MGRKRKQYQNKGINKETLIGLILTCVVFYVVYSVSMLWLFTTNCIFEWPLRFDVATCWSEQKEPAQDRAADTASNFMPKFRH